MIIFFVFMRRERNRKKSLEEVVSEDLQQDLGARYRYKGEDTL